MGRALAILLACFALFYFGPTYSWWGAGLFLLLALMPLLAASASAQAGRSVRAANVVIIRARCHTVQQPAGKMTVYQPWVGPFAVLVEPAWLRRWPDGQELEVELCPMGSDGNLTGAVVVYLPGVSPPPGKTSRVSMAKREKA